MFEAATADDYSELLLQIRVTTPGSLACLWEAFAPIRSLASSLIFCQIERRLNKVRDPQPLSSLALSQRSSQHPPGSRAPLRGAATLGFRSIARPLVELIEKEKAARLTSNCSVRPHSISFASICVSGQAFTTVLHFDGHGAYSAGHMEQREYTFQGPEGKLVFETENGQA